MGGEERVWYDDGLEPEELAFQRLYGPWKVSTPADAQELLTGYDGEWWITGGWAIHAFTGVRREHEDLDVSLWRRDIEKLRGRLKGRYDLWSNAGGRLFPLTDERPAQPADADQIWLRKHALAPWEFDLQPNPDRDGRWIFRRDPTLDYALDEVTWLAPDGIRYLNPEMALAYKARLNRPKDNQDLAAALPKLTQSQRTWLADMVEPPPPWPPLAGPHPIELAPASSAQGDAQRSGERSTGGPEGMETLVSEIGMTASSVAGAEAPPYALAAEAVVAAAASDAVSGLAGSEATSRLSSYGPNEIAAEKPPSVWVIAAQQLRDPMNIMLVAVVVVSLLIGEVSTGIIVALLILLNVGLGTRQELTARASVDALANLQVPQARVVRDGDVRMIAATQVVPGDIVHVEAGDVVPADGRIVGSATLEAQEAALTGESAPIAKGAGALDATEVGLGDQTNMLFQGTSVTRGTGTIVVTATGMQTQMGRIATMLTSVTRTRSPLQRELDSLTKVLGIVAWGSVAVIVVVGLIRGVPGEDLLLLGIAMAISAIPTGMPAFVSALLSLGAKELAEAKAVVKNLTDVETLGATSAINTDKTGTLTLNQMMVSTLYASGTWFTVDGEGYRKSGAIRSVAGVPVPDFTRLALGLALDSDAVVGDDGSVIGDPTEAALVVLAAKLGIDAEETRRTYPRLSEVPFDSEYKFMATFHRVKVDGVEHVIELVKGAPDVVVARCSQAGGPLSGSQVPIAQSRAGIDEANVRMGEKGLRVLAFAARLVTDDELAAMTDDPMSLTEGLSFVGLAGIIDPLRTEAKSAVGTALTAGIDVRMITGDHAVTAQAIGAELGLGPGAISGTELLALTDEQLKRRLPELHVFGRVTPQDKLRLARAMQEEGMIVAMTGDAVNDAAALKQADIGVAMGSGSEVTKQAARMVLTDDNFGTLVHAVEIGRRVYDKVVSYVRYQMTQLLSLVLLFLGATVFNINDGVAMTPSMVLFLLFFATAIGVVIIAVDPGDPDVMHRPPRDPGVPITNRNAVIRWVAYAFVLFLAAGGPLVAGPDEPSTTQGTVSMTMTFVVMGLGTVFNAVVNRRDPTSGLTPPIVKALAIGLIPVVLLFLATQLPTLQSGLLTVSLSPRQWLTCIGLAALLPIVVELDKVIRRRGQRMPATLSPEHAVAPARAWRAPAEVGGTEK